MPPRPLPNNPYNLKTHPHLHEAFSQCLEMSTAGNDETRHMLACCLGYLIIEFSRISDEARDIVAHEVVACKANFEMMAELANIYIDHLIRLCESYYFTPTC